MSCYVSMNEIKWWWWWWWWWWYRNEIRLSTTGPTAVRKHCLFTQFWGSSRHACSLLWPNRLGTIHADRQTTDRQKPV